MSHVIKANLEIKDQDLFTQVAHDLGFQVGLITSVQMYNRQVTGMPVHLPGWTYPVIVTQEGHLLYDNYGGQWGDQIHLQELIQAYAQAQVEQEARQVGQYILSQEQEADGTLVLRVGGGW